jgi:RND family efflux transporter MFP subunit
LILAVVGCGGDPHGASKGPPRPTEVSVSKVKLSKNIDYEDFTGRTEAKESVEIKARVTGHLEEILFKEGDLVKKGQLLYRVDDRTYKAELAKLQGEITRNEALSDRLGSDLGRARRMRVGDAISREEYDKITSNKDEAGAALDAAKAAARRAELNVEFTKIYSPIDGKISRTRITRGNLVTQDQTLLTNIVSVDPIYAHFDADEQTVLRLQKRIRDKKLTMGKKVPPPLLLGTQIEKGFPHKGVINFVDNQIDPSTGTLRIRGEFPNKEAILTPGLFVRIRLPLGEKKQAIVISERALGSDQGQRYVFVVGEDNKVVQRPVEVGPLRDGLRVIRSGVKVGEWVIVNGLQRVREGSIVEPTKVEMPKPAEPAGK